jgi:hypothetical protein
MAGPSRLKARMARHEALEALHLLPWTGTGTEAQRGDGPVNGIRESIIPFRLWGFARALNEAAGGSHWGWWPPAHS